MTDFAPHDRPVLQWGWAGAALEGESGDLHAVVPFPGGVLVAVIDGLGHGPEAAQAARAAEAVIEACASDPLRVVVQRCHEAIRHTRGVAMSLASFDARSSSMTWLGVGNVEALLLRAGASQAGAGARGPDTSYEAVHCRGGVVGYRLPPLVETSLPVNRGDLLIMATDGIRHGFVPEIDREEPDPHTIAAHILRGYARNSDDALVLVARHLGSGAKEPAA